MYNMDFTTSSVPNTIQQISPNYAGTTDEITILADSANTGIVFVGSGQSIKFPLSPGASLSLRKLNWNQIFAVSSIASQLLHLIGGGT